MRLGAVAFGIGSMIHDALRFGELVETNVDGKCHGKIMMSLPVTHIVFTFVQVSWKIMLGLPVTYTYIVLTFVQVGQRVRFHC